MIARPAPRIFVSAGEPSGDLHGAGVVRALRARHPDATIEALGGPRMAAAGATLRYRMEGLAAFGLVEVVSKLGAHCRLLRAMRDDFRAGRYDLAILIDYPGFHLRVAEAAAEGGYQGAVLHRAAAVGLAARAGAPVRGRGGPPRGGPPVRAAVLRRARPPQRLRRASADRSRAAARPARRHAHGSASPPRPSAGRFSRAAAHRRCGASGRRFATRRSSCSARAGATAVVVRGGGGRRVSRSGSAHRGRGATPDAVFAAADAASRQVGDDDARGGARRHDRWWSPTRRTR